MTTCHGHSPGCAILPPMMRRLHAGDVTLLTPHSCGSDLDGGDGGEAEEGEAAGGRDSMAVRQVIEEGL